MFNIAIEPDMVYMKIGPNLVDEAGPIIQDVNFLSEWEIYTHVEI